MQLIPYLHFQGNCEEALNTYKMIFNGEIESVNRYDNPALAVPEEHKNKILHSTLNFGKNTLMLDDAISGNTIDYGNGAALNIIFSNLEEATSVFGQLAEGGNILVPFKIQFWGSWFGEVADRFGIRWMIMFES